MTQRGEDKFLTYGRKVVRKIHESVRNQNGNYESRKNDNLEIR